MNSDMPKILDYLSNEYEESYVSIATNGTLLTKEWIDRLLTLPKVEINVSLKAATRRTYKKITGCDRFEKVLSNIKMLVRKIQSRHEPPPSVWLTFVLVKDNVTELPQFVELAASLGISLVRVLDLMIFRDEHQKYSMATQPQIVEEYFQKALIKASSRGVFLAPFLAPPYFRFQYSEDESSVVRYEYDYKCYEPWYSLRVGEKGDVSPCCYSNDIMGNIFTESLIEIWNGAKYQYMRSKVNSPDPPICCRDCIAKSTEIDITNQMHSAYRILFSDRTTHSTE